MRFQFSCLRAAFLSRPNRFLVYARLEESNETISAHCPDPGRLTELLLPGVPIYVSLAAHGNRKTKYDLRLVEHPNSGQLVSLDTRVPNALVRILLRARTLPQFANFTGVHAERSLLDSGSGRVKSRIDFFLDNEQGDTCWLEVKSVTLVENRVALFPDAPTTRGRRHLQELAHIAQTGQRCAVLFLVQRPDADFCAPNERTDPDFARALINANKSGVEIYAFTCTLTLERIELARRIPVCL